MTVQMKLEGFQELDRELEKLSKAAGTGVLRRALKKSAEPMAELAASIAPVDDGDLKNSITVSTKLDKDVARSHRRMFKNSRSAVEMFVGPSYNLGAGGRHGHLLEFGTYKMSPRPFARPAWDQDKQNVIERLKKDIWAEIEKATARAERKAARQALKG